MVIAGCILKCLQHGLVTTQEINELDEVVLQWNTHKIQKYRNSRAPSGRPAIMFEMPNLYEADSYLSEVPPMCLDIIEVECTRLQFPCDEDVYNVCNYIIDENLYRSSTTDPYVALQLYFNLRNKLYSLLESNN
ncbi:hypothetical protein NQ315_008197 [Exocentrus adspersus]|uniref:Uncharacterized protein n=1 Tax=Exocentrus adspersus TaxID=1586481 RepID=A0AAV8V4Y1_9CUCU|nr:hypothetical protein NQ315_008197 [Exocentrus adspersus]